VPGAFKAPPRGREVSNLRSWNTEHYAFEEISEGIIFGRARQEGAALSNTALVDLGQSTLLFDTSLTLHSARNILDASRAFTRRPPSLTVNSHWHLDHILGNQVFAERPIYASRRTIEILLEKRAELEGELSQKKLESDIRELERQRSSATTEAGRAPYDAVLRINRTLLQEAIDLRFTLPTTGFEENLQLPGDRQASLLTFGGGHTESDTILHLAQDRILFAGDLVVAESHPNLTSGDPRHWLTVLDHIDDLRPERIVTGHGPMGSRETVAMMRDYLTVVLELAQKPKDPKIPERFQRWAEPDQFTQNVAYTRTWLATHDPK
jgi:cyclase